MKTLQTTTCIILIRVRCKNNKHYYMGFQFESDPPQNIEKEFFKGDLPGVKIGFWHV